MHQIPRILYFLLATVFTGAVYAQPKTEIYLFDVATRDGKTVLENPVNITQRPGYDNQPFFHPDKPILYYASDNEEGRTDIVEYNLETRQTKKLTNTPEREYSPTVTPDKKYISCILQRDNGAQNLVKYPIGGGDPIILIDDLIVGYHAWLDDNNLITFILGEPVTLQLVTLRPRKNKIVAENVGRSLHRIPGTGALSFVHKVSVDYWNIKKIREDGTIEIIAQTLAEREDLAWMKDGTILMSEGNKVYALKVGKNAQWLEIQIASGEQLNSFSRLALNPQGNKIAIVVNE